MLTDYNFSCGSSRKQSFYYRHTVFFSGERTEIKEKPSLPLLSVSTANQFSTKLPHCSRKVNKKIMGHWEVQGIQQLSGR